MILCTVLESDLGRISLRRGCFCEVPFLLDFGVQHLFKYGWFWVPRRMSLEVVLVKETLSE